MPLDGSDAQALEGALAMTETERDAAIAERDRLRRELEALRHRCRREARVSGAHEDILGGVADRLDAILRGES
jgi:hypothetical protein